MMKQTVLLSDWTRPPPMERTAPWQQALSPRERQPYPSIPPHPLRARLHAQTHTQTHTYRAQRIYQCTNTPGIHTNTSTQVLHSRGGPLTTAHFRSLKKCLNPAGPQGLRYTRNKQPCKKAFGNMTKCFFNITNQ